jgi:hypothetical protein
MGIEASCRARRPQDAQATTAPPGQAKQIVRRSVEVLAAGGAAALERIVLAGPRVE